MARIVGHIDTSASSPSQTEDQLSFDVGDERCSAAPDVAHTETDSAVGAAEVVETAPAARPAVATRRARLLVAYDGSRFHGFAANEGVETVAGRLTEALIKILRMPVELTGAGRTDAGVHGWGQVVSCDLPAHTKLDNLQKRLNSLLAPAIVVRSVDWAPAQFDARFSALWRHYRYTILNTPQPSPFLAATTWHVPKPLDVRAMQLGSDVFIGEHDFSSFCRRPKGQVDPVMIRRVLLTRWSEPEPGILRFEIRANAFCHQMVRSIVGTLVDVGLGKRRAGDQRRVLLTQDRSAAGTIAPPEGLCLWEVGYPPDSEIDTLVEAYRRRRTEL
jgi:tRNA pseudouridine38-40 synthase